MVVFVAFIQTMDGHYIQYLNVLIQTYCYLILLKLILNLRRKNVACISLDLVFITILMKIHLLWMFGSSVAKMLMA